VSYYSKPLSADVGSIQIFCWIRLTENVRWINKWVLIEIINTNRNKEKIMRSLFLASTSWLENVCYFKSQRNNKCKNCIKLKNVNVQLSFLIRDIWAGGKGHMPFPQPSWIFVIFIWNYHYSTQLNRTKGRN
jgi:hypothetical protein